jgi:murein hydrolase activator
VRSILLLLVLSAAPLLASTDPIASRQQELKRVQRELERKNKERKEADRRAREVAQEVAQISKEWRSSRRALKDAEDRLRRAEKQRAEAEDRLWAARLDVGQWNAVMAREMRILYERRVAAESGRFLELARRRALLQDKAAAAAQARDRHERLKTAHEDVASTEIDLKSLRRRREEEADRVREARKSMTQALTTAQGRKAMLEEEISDLQASARRFESLIQNLIQEKIERETRAKAEEARKARDRAKTAKKGKARPAMREEAALLAGRGKLPWPVDGTVVDRFGKFRHPELDTFVFSNGIKIRPAAPASVRAVSRGEVLYAGEFMGYGLMALVAHPDNLYTIYAHLGRLQVSKGQKVSVGESLGQSGVDAEERPLVYFELRLHGEAVDPLLWLK